MPVISVDKDTEALEMTVVAEFDAPVERVWQLWADPRQLERWWGPPSHPATVVDHDLTPGGWVRYFMTSPEGDKYTAGGSERDGGGTRATILSTFPSAEALQQQLDMGMEQGMREAMSQMDAVLTG